MNNNKIRSYLLSGVFLIFIGLKDIERFNIFYEGIALIFGFTALVIAGIEYKRKIDEGKK
jgi:hypothetical protein